MNNKPCSSYLSYTLKPFLKIYIEQCFHFLESSQLSKSHMNLKVPQADGYIAFYAA